MDYSWICHYVVTLTAVFSVVVVADFQKPDDPFEYDGFDGIPGVSFEFKIEIAASTRECVFQKIKYGSTFLVNFEVIHGADRNIDFVVTRPDREVFERQMWVRSGDMEKDIDMPGEYMVCLDNTRGRFSGKIVYFRLAVFNKQDLEVYAQSAQEMTSSIGNLGESMANMTNSIMRIRRLISLRKSTASGDYYMALTSNKRVQNWSFIMSFLICVTSLIQVYFVRKMFRSVNVTPSNKPRA